MKKTILKIMSGIVFACVLFVSLSGYVDAISENKPEKTEAGEFNETFSGSPALTQEDVTNHFQNYASVEGTYYFTTDENQNISTMNHVGTVMDVGTDEPISGAVIVFNSERSIVTDQNGRFQIPDFPAGKYDCVIHAQDYKDSFYLNMKADNVGSTIISFFYVSKKTEYIEDHDLTQ